MRRRLNQMSNQSRIFDCFSRRFGKVVSNLQLSNLIDSDLASHAQSFLELNSEHVKCDVWTEPNSSSLKIIREGQYLKL